MKMGEPRGTAISNYVHGYEKRESSRLVDQANTLAELLHHDTRFPPGASVLEAGCGIGAQTVLLARQNPGTCFVSVDISQDSLDQARAAVEAQAIGSVTFQRADIFHLPFASETFDHVFVCFVLEHLPEPAAALSCLRKVLKKGGSITVIEGDHGSFYCHPESKAARLAVQCLIEIQARMKGNSLIGRQLYPLLTAAGFEQTTVSPRMVYVDSSRPALVDGFSKKTFIAMVEGVKKQALSWRLVDEKTWDQGIRDLYRATEADGTFCYTFFKGTAWNPMKRVTGKQ